MQLSREDIAARIPHAGSMCLLDGVREWSAEHIVCTASSHRDAANPLRAAGRLGVLCGIEYAAQAMAMHGGLGMAAAPDGSAQRPKAGFLASVRGVSAHVSRLDDVAGNLRIEARRLSGSDNLVMYEFAVHSDSAVLIEGRAAVVLDASAALPGEAQ
jgi:predicted hotdog family 3-hydroxylacyl-ACP dehydratase